MRAQRINRGETARLGIGFTFSAAYTVLPAIISAFRERHPEVELFLHEMHTADQLDALFLDEIQLGILRRPIRDTTIVTETFHAEPLVVALPADHKLAAKPRLSLKDLAHAPFVMASQNRVGFFYWIKTLCREAGFEPRVSREVPDMRNVVELVSVGLGIALVPEFARRSSVTNVVYRYLEDSPLTELALAWKEPQESPAVEAFLLLARKMKIDVPRKAARQKRQKSRA
jgi:DNA-binding transcriptional LysR family regulator